MSGVHNKCVVCTQLVCTQVVCTQVVCSVYTCAKVVCLHLDSEERTTPYKPRVAALWPHYGRAV